MKKYHCMLLSLITSSSILANVITITDENQYNQAVLKSDTPVVVEFAADWCGVCKGIEKSLQEVAQEPEFAHVTFAQVNIDQLEGVSRQNGIVGVPTFMYIEKGQKVNEEVGIQNMTAFKDHLRTNIRTSFKVAQAKVPAQAPPAITTKLESHKPIEQVEPEQQAPTEKEKPQPVEQEQNWFTQLLCYIKTLILTIITKIQELLTAIFDTVKGWFGG